MLMWILTALAIIAGVEGYSDGYFPQACGPMLVEHSSGNTLIKPQDSEPPYDILVSGHPITVTLKAKPTPGFFRGFMLEARKSKDDNSPVGTFTVNELTTIRLTCNGLAGSAVSNYNNNKKSEIKVTWTSDGTDREIFFRATFVQDYVTFWRPMDTDVISLTTTPQPSTVPSTTRPTTTHTTEPSTTDTTDASTTDTTKPSTTDTTKPSTTDTTEASTTDTTKPSTTDTTEASTTDTTEASTTDTTEASTTDTTKPSTTDTTDPNTTDTTKPDTTDTTKPDTTDTTEASTTDTTEQNTTETTKPSTTDTTKPNTTDTTEPNTTDTTEPNTTDTTEPNTTNTTEPSTTASPTKQSTTTNTITTVITGGISTSIPPEDGNSSAYEIIVPAMSVDLIAEHVKMGKSHIVTVAHSNTAYSYRLNKVSKICFGLICVALEVLTIIVVCVMDPDVVLIALVGVVIGVSVIELVICCLPIGRTHELKDICDIAVEVCSVFHNIFTIAFIFVVVTELPLKVMAGYAAWIFLYAIIYFLTIHIKPVLWKTLTENSRRSEQYTGQKQLSAAGVAAIIVSVVFIAGSVAFALAVMSL